MQNPLLTLLIALGLSLPTSAQGTFFVDDNSYEQNVNLGGIAAVNRIPVNATGCLSEVLVFRPNLPATPTSNIMVIYGVSVAGGTFPAGFAVPGGQMFLDTLPATLNNDGTQQSVVLPAGLQVRDGDEVIVGIIDDPALDDVPVDINSSGAPAFVDSGGGFVAASTVGVTGPFGFQALLTAPPAGLCGDINLDGVVDLTDVLWIAQVSVGLTPCYDANGSGSIDIIDCILIAQIAAGLASPTPGNLPPWTTPAGMAAADVNGNGIIETTDALLLARYLVGLQVLVCSC